MTTHDRASNRWVLCALLFGATLLNYLDRQTLSVTAPLIRAEMHLDLEQVGRLFSALLWSYGLGQIAVGFVLDRVAIRTAYAVSVALWSIAGAAAALTTGLVGLAAMRALLGLCESANWPAALRVVSRNFAPAERGLPVGIFQSGASVGAIVAPPLLIGMTTAYGWRSGFLAVGAAGVIWVALWLAIARPAGPAAAVGRPAGLEPLAHTLGSRRFWATMLASAFINPVLYFYVSWLPTYFVESGQSFGAALAGKLTVVYLTLDVGYISGGALVGFLARRMDVRRARLRVSAAALPMMASLPLVAWLPSPGAVVAVLSIAAIGLGWSQVNYLAALQDVSPERVATISGFGGAAGSLSGAFLMWAVGAIAQHSGSFALPFFIVAGMPFVSFAGLVMASKIRAVA